MHINKCEVCDFNELTPVLDLGWHPLCDDLVELGSDRKCEEFPIEIGFCTNCCTAHQLNVVPKETLFPKTYHYRARMTGSVLSGMEDLVRSCVDHLGTLNGKTVLDVGCNDGSLLNFFEEAGAKCLGVEPTNAAKESTHITYNQFFDTETAQKILDDHGKIDIITFTNVFAHIEDLPTLLKNVARLLKEDGTLVVENHYLGTVLETGQFDTFYHEHPRTYSEKSFRHIASSLERRVSKIEYVSRYGGNIRVFIDSRLEAGRVKNETKFLAKFLKMKSEIDVWVSTKREEIAELVNKHGPLAAKAFPGRAAILIKLLDLSTDHVRVVYEITGSKKVGYYIPGTRIPIEPEINLFQLPFSDQPEIILNLAWHLPIEVRNNLSANNCSALVIDIMEMNHAG
jgi:SAM-dependent methyltransferase